MEQPPRFDNFTDSGVKTWVREVKDAHALATRRVGTSEEELITLCEAVLAGTGELHRRGVITRDEAAQEANKWFRLKRTYEEQETQKLQNDKNTYVGVELNADEHNTAFPEAVERNNLMVRVANALREGLVKDLKNADVVELNIDCNPPTNVITVTLNLNDTNHPAISVFATVTSVLQANKAYRTIRVVVHIETKILSFFTVGG